MPPRAPVTYPPGFPRVFSRGNLGGLSPARRALFPDKTGARPIVGAGPGDYLDTTTFNGGGSWRWASTNSAAGTTCDTDSTGTSRSGRGKSCRAGGANWG